MATTIASKAIALLLPLQLFCSPYAYFTPPTNWKLADPAKLSPKVQVGFISKEKRSFVSSINLTTEPVKLSQQEYLEQVMKLYKSRKENRLLNIGQISTSSGKADLLQIEMEKPWGSVLILQSILVSEEMAYILTAVSSKKELPTLYPEIISTFSSFDLKTSPFEFISDKTKLNKLQDEYKSVIEGFKRVKVQEKLDPQAALSHRKFINGNWKPFEKFLTTEYKELGIYFPSLMLSYTKKQLLTSEPL